MKILYILLFLSVSVYAYIPTPVNIIDPRIKLNPKLVLSSSTVYNDSIYVYGGALSLALKNGTTLLYKYDLNEDTFKFDLSIVNTTNRGPECWECQPIHLPGTSKLLLLTFDAATADVTQTLRYQPFIFDFETLTWTNLASTATYNGGARGDMAFELRTQHSVVLGNDGNVYIIGGLVYLDETACSVSVISYNVNSNTFNVVEQDAPACLVSGSAYVTQNPNDEINFVLSSTDNGTFFTYENNTYGYYDQFFIIYSNATYTFSTSTGNWTTYSIAGEPPYDRFGATAQYNPATNLLHIFGGAMPIQNGINLYPEVLTLDTTAGQQRWYNISYTDTEDTINPLVEARAKLSSALLKGKYFVTFYGQTIELQQHVSLPEIDIFALPEKIEHPENYPMTLKSVPPTKPSKNKVSILALKKHWQFLIVAAIVAAIILLWIFIVFLGQWLGNIDSATDVLIKTLYDRRIGEPVWTELAHCFCRIISFAIFVFFIIYCYDNIANTTISTTSETETLDNITYPDVRFCFTNWNLSNTIAYNSVIQCQIKGESYIDKQNCTDYIKYLDNDIQAPLYDNSNYTTQCWLFKSNSSIVATESRPTLVFSVKKDETFISDSSSIYVSAYDVNENPLRYLFFEEPLPKDWTQEQLEKWAQLGDNSVQVLDTFTYINMNDSLSITFDTKTHKNLNPKGAWNYIGSLFPSYIPTENFTQKYTHRAKVPDGTVIELSPITFDKEIITYKRDNTILGAIATAGGILGLITTILILVFGARPASAWGFLHIIFRRRHERLLSETLDTRLFNTHALKREEETAYVPLATPVESRFIRAFNEINQFQYEYDHTQAIDEETDLQKRIMRLEARNQMMEIVLKSYYIDDHIFHTLNAQRELNPGIGRALSSYFMKDQSGDASPVTVDTTQNTSINENLFADEQKGKSKRRFSFKFM